MSIFSDIAGVVGSVAPVIASALGGPLAGKAVSAISEAITGKPDSTESEVQAAIRAMTPEQVIALKQAEQKFTLDLQQQGIDIFSLEVKDRDSAREMAQKTSLWPQIVLTSLWTAGFFVVLYLVLSNTITLSDGLRDAVMMLLGLMVGEVKNSNAFWFGSSFGSKEKNDQQFQIAMKK